MRQSLSEKATPLLAVGLSLVLAAVAIADQAGGRSLFDHATSVYAPYGKEVSSGTVYGLVYGVAVFNVLLWLLVTGLARTPRLIAAGAAGLALLLTVTCALLLLFSTEYGVHPFPPLWGILALLPAVAGTLAVARLARGRR